MLRTETYDFGDEIERIRDRQDEIAEQIHDTDGDAQRELLLAEGQELDVHLKGLRWAKTAHEDDDVAVWDEDVDSVTLGGLTGGEMGWVEDEAGELDAGTGGSRVLLVAEGTVNAPYVDDAQSDKARAGATGKLPFPYLKWAEDRVEELTGITEGNGSGFADSLAAARTETSDAE